MTKISKEFKIGIAFILAILLLYYGISFLKGVNIFKPSNKYMVVFNDVTGLTSSAPITVNGLQVGLVSSMEIDPMNTKRVIVYIDMDKGVKIPKNSKMIMDVGMLGGATIKLEPGTDIDGYITLRDTIHGERKKGLMDAADDLAPKIGELLPRIDSILASVQTLVGSPVLTSTMNNLDQTMANVNNITTDLAKTTKQLNSMMIAMNKDIPTITGNLASTTDKINKMDMQATYNSLDSTMKNIQHLSDQLTRKDNSLGLLLNDRQLHDSINSTLNNASLLLKDLRENPNKYINVKVF